MSVRKLLVATRISPAHQGVGTIFLRSLLEMYPADRVVFGSWTDTIESEWPGSLADVPRRNVAPVPEYGVSSLGSRVRRHTLGAHSVFMRQTRLRRTVSQLVRFGREHAVEAVLVPLASPTEIHLAVPLARALKVPLLTIVWDPPEHYLSMFWGYHGRAMRDVMRSFGNAVRMSERCAVASDEMKAHYERQFGTECVTLIHGFPSDQWIPPSAQRNREGPFVIGYAGSIYAKKEWNALLDALASVEWRLDERNVVLRVLASSISIDTTHPVRIEYLGWHSGEAALRLLGNTDVCYIPYWFDARYRDAVRYCFPNKISTYLAAGRPLFFHGPAESTPAHFLARYPAGLACHTLDPFEIIASLKRFIEEPDLLMIMADATRRALREELSDEVFRRRFASFVGVETSELRTHTVPLKGSGT